MKEIFAIPENIPFYLEFALNNQIEKIFNIWLSIETIRKITVDVLEGEKVRSKGQKPKKNYLFYPSTIFSF
jgi:hypothetical protein